LIDCCVGRTDGQTERQMDGTGSTLDGLRTINFDDKFIRFDTTHDRDG